LIALILVALSANFLANPNNGLLVEYGPNSIGEKNNTFKPPGFIDTYQGIDRIHPIGTDGRGRDVAALMLHGSRTSLLLGFIASIISVILGSLMGILAGFYGDHRFSIHPLAGVMLVLGIFLAFFISREMSYRLDDGTISFTTSKFILFFSGIMALIIFIINKANNNLNSRIRIPVDSLVMRLAEIFRAVPILFILLTLIAFIKSPSVWTTALLLGCLGWSRILRLVRGEIMEIKNKSYITNAELLGLSDFKVIMNHLLPNVLPIILISMAFMISSFILLESTLSFLGLGLPLDTPSWGGILKQSRENFNAWWLAIFPGLTITLTLFSLNILAESYNKSSR